MAVHPSRDRVTPLISLLAIAVLVVAGQSAVGGSAQANEPGPNGRVAFARYVPRLDDFVTYTVNPDGSNLQRLFPGTSGAPHWSPDGEDVAIAACGNPPVCDTAAVIVNPDTGDYRVLTSPERLFTGCLVWTPDGQRLACEGLGDRHHPNLNGIYTIRASDGLGLTRITSNPRGDDNPIEYAPDGQQLLFARSDPARPSRPEGANQALFVVNVDGTGLHRITPWGFFDGDGSWSPDGTKIAAEHNGSLFTVHPDGSGLERVPLATDSLHYGVGDFSWSPDGTRIAFLLFTWDSPGGPYREGIATSTVNGRDVEWVTTSPTFDHQTDWGTHPPLP